MLHKLGCNQHDYILLANVGIGVYKYIYFGKRILPLVKDKCRLNIRKYSFSQRNGTNYLQIV